MATDLGTDVACYPDLDASFGLVSGFTLIGQDLARRLETPRGGLFYDTNYGTDIRGWVNAAGTAGEIASLKAAIEAECKKDERVQDVTATVTYSQATSTLAIKLLVTVKDNAVFTLVLAVTALSVSILPIG